MWYEAFAWVICGICCIALTITVIYYFQKAVKQILKDSKEKNETIKEISNEIKKINLGQDMIYDQMQKMGGDQHQGDK